MVGYTSFLRPEWIRNWFARRARLGSARGALIWQLQALQQGRWAVYYNGNCSFCRKWVARAKRVALPQVQWLDFQQCREEVAHLHPCFDQTAYLIIDRRVALPGFRGFRKLALAVPPLWPLLPFLYLPGARWIGDAVYRFVSVRYGPVVRQN